MGFEKGNSSKIYGSKQGQLLSTLPKPIALSFFLYTKNASALCNIENNQLVLKRKEGFEIGHEIKIYFIPPGSYRYTLPKQMAESIGLKQGDTIYYYYKDNKIIISKINLNK